MLDGATALGMMDYGGEFFHASAMEDGDLGHVATQEQQQQQQPGSAVPLSEHTVMQPHSSQRQSFYPTPNSMNMPAGTNEKSFMSPFPAGYQKYSTVGSEGAYCDLDELLFTPMMSPAMTPMQQFTGTQRTSDVDWDQFDQHLFALTDPAMDNLHGQNTQSQALALQASISMTEPVSKKQRVSSDSAGTSRHTSPRTPLLPVTQGSVYHHKRDTTMAAPALPHYKDPSPDSNEGISPADLEQVQIHSGNTPSQYVPTPAGADHGQPITPSMLMSIQRKTKITGNDIPQGLSLNLDLSHLPNYSISADSQAMPSPAITMPSPSARPTNPARTPIIAGTPHIVREIRPRPIAPAHSRSHSVNSSPALGPQRHRASPELRPILPGGMSPQVGAMLASKSNYQHIVDGTYDQLNISYPSGMTQGLEVRRTSHKAAEQKRRDHLKECFEQMRTILPDRPEIGASKVAILKKGYEHILQLHAAIKDRDAEIARLKAGQIAKQDTESG